MTRRWTQTMAPSASRTASGSIDTADFRYAQRAAFFLDVTAASGTTPTLDVVIETKDPASGKWFPLASFSQATGATTERITADPMLSDDLRVTWTLGGTSPDFTFSVGAIFEADS